MKTKQHFVAEIPEQPIAWARAGYNKKTLIIYEDEKRNKYKERIRKIVKDRMEDYGTQVMTDAVIGYVIFCFEMPKSWSKKKRLECCGKYVTAKPDKDNLEKMVWDSLQPLLIQDDKQVVDIHSKKIWGERGYTLIDITEIEQ